MYLGLLALFATLCSGNHAAICERATTIGPEAYEIWSPAEYRSASTTAIVSSSPASVDEHILRLPMKVEFDEGIGVLTKVGVVDTMCLSGAVSYAHVSGRLVGVVNEAVAYGTNVNIDVPMPEPWTGSAVVDVWVTYVQTGGVAPTKTPTHVEILICKQSAVYDVSIDSRKEYGDPNAEMLPGENDGPGVLAYAIVEPSGISHMVNGYSLDIDEVGAPTHVVSGTGNPGVVFASFAAGEDEFPFMSGYLEVEALTSPDRYRVTIKSSHGLHPSIAGSTVITEILYDARTMFKSAEQTTMEEDAYDPDDEGAVAGAPADNASRGFESIGYSETSSSETTYNFRGNPLREESTNSRTEGGGSPATISRWVEYAYWGASKYYQRKATKDSRSRITYTDYYDSSAAAGRKGMIYRTYDPKYGAYLYTTGIDETESTPEINWRNSIALDGAAIYSAQFDYTDEGQVDSVYKLKSTGSPNVYVHTTTDYVASDYGIDGLVGSVVEDDGGIGRLTLTEAYDVLGRATETIDSRLASAPTTGGRHFRTIRDGDGITLAVQQYDGDWIDRVLYTVGSTNGEIDNGVVTYIVEDEENTQMDFSFYAKDEPGCAGMPKHVGTYNPGVGYQEVLYQYNLAGDRERSYYHTPNGWWGMEFSDYITRGGAVGTSRMPRTTKRLFADDPSTGNSFEAIEEWSTLGTNNALDESTGKEEITWNAYDVGGRLTRSAFAQSFSTHSYPDTRAVATYNYNEHGQLDLVGYDWEEFDTNGSSGPVYTPKPIARVAYTYDADSSLRDSAAYSRWHNVSSVWTEQPISTETYDYDVLDQLTDYDNSESSPKTYSYDAAGNRDGTGYVCDNLNRMTTALGSSRDYDLRGNMLYDNYAEYQWDWAGRMCRQLVESTDEESETGFDNREYRYRPDGLRILRVLDPHAWGIWDFASSFYDEFANVNDPTYRYFYDGQNVHEDDYTRSVSSVTYKDLNRYGLGARGIDWFERETKTESTVTGRTTVFPLYDGHGNNLASITRSGVSSSGVDLRLYDVWGSPRSGTHDLDTRYCASIGHRTDNESGLIYMRARYYDPSIGRFVSEDPALDGSNWYMYCRNGPVTSIDPTGRNLVSDAFNSWVNKFAEFALFTAGVTFFNELRTQGESGALNIPRAGLKAVKSYVVAMIVKLMGMDVLKAAFAAEASPGAAEVAVYTCYSFFLIAFICLMDLGMDSLIDAWTPLK